MDIRSFSGILYSNSSDGCGAGEAAASKKDKVNAVKGNGGSGNDKNGEE